jgi:hypothetical protein
VAEGIIQRRKCRDQTGSRAGLVGVNGIEESRLDRCVKVVKVADLKL